MSKNKKTSFGLTKKQCINIIKSTLNDGYIIKSYGNLLNLIKADHLLYNFLNKYKDISPDRVLEEFMKSYLDANNGLVLEVGCGFGGFLNKLSQKAKFVFGLDVSFLHLFYASCILKRLPVPIKKHGIRIVGDITKKRSIKVEPVDNLALIVGLGDNLPLKDSTLSIASSCNTLDIINNPIGLLKEKIRVLKNKGLLLCSDPHGFSSESWKNLRVKENQSVWERVQEILNPSVKILEERDNIPWVLYYHDRVNTIHRNHCFCGIKIR